MAAWIERENKFGLVKPPQWFLHQLEVYDPELRLFYSARDPVFLLARRAAHRLESAVVGKLHDHPDTRFLGAKGLILIRSFLPMITWTTEVIDYLYHADLWRHGGAQHAANAFESAEQAAKDRQARAFEDECGARSSEAYRAAKTRLGQRIFLPSSTALSPASV